ncbi:resistance protein, partial [Trifolium pratense]
MTDRGYNNFYIPDEYEMYQQCPPDNYGQTPEARLEETMIKFMEMQQQQMHEQQQQLQQMQDQHQQYLKNSLARAKNLENQLSQLAQQMSNQQNMEIQINTQTIPDEKDNILNEECRGSMEGVENNEEEKMCDGCVVEKTMKEIETPHDVELPQDFPCTVEANNVDNEKMMMVAEEIEGLVNKEESCEQKKEMENKAVIDRVIDEICALFNKKQLGRIWTP